MKGGEPVEIIKTHSSALAAKKTKEDKRYTVCYLLVATVKLKNSVFRISKTTKLISTKFIYFLFYIYTTLHIKIEGSISQDICS